MSHIIETERLIIRKITEDDFDDLLLLHSDPEVQKFTGEAVQTSIEEVQKGIRERTFKDYEKYGYGRWAVIWKETGEFTGWAGLKYLPEFEETDLGYRFNQKFWGKGIATESSIAILNYGFKELGLKRIIAVAMPEHKASMRVMEKVGMKFYRAFPYDEGGPDDMWYEIFNPKSKSL